MVNLTKTAGTLDELMARDNEIKEEIKALNKQRKTIGGALKSLKKLSGELPAEKPRRRKKPAASAA